MFKLSAIEQYIEKLPDNLQMSALSAIKEERDRWERNDLTSTEKALRKMSYSLVRAMAQEIDEIAISVLRNMVPVCATQENKD